MAVLLTIHRYKKTYVFKEHGIFQGPSFWVSIIISKVYIYVKPKWQFFLKLVYGTSCWKVHAAKIEDTLHEFQVTIRIYIYIHICDINDVNSYYNLPTKIHKYIISIQTIPISLHIYHFLSYKKVYIYIYLEPKWPLFCLEEALFCGVDLQKYIK